MAWPRAQPIFVCTCDQGIANTPLTLGQLAVGGTGTAVGASVALGTFVELGALDGSVVAVGNTVITGVSVTVAATASVGVNCGVLVEELTVGSAVAVGGFIRACTCGRARMPATVPNAVATKVKRPRLNHELLRLGDPYSSLTLFFLMAMTYWAICLKIWGE